MKDVALLVSSIIEYSNVLDSEYNNDIAHGTSIHVLNTISAKGSRNF